MEKESKGVECEGVSGVRSEGVEWESEQSERVTEQGSGRMSEVRGGGREWSEKARE